MDSRSGIWSTSPAFLANTALVYLAQPTDLGHTNHIRCNNWWTDASVCFQRGREPSEHQPQSPAGGATNNDGSLLPWRSLRQQGLDDDVITTMLQARRESSNKLYKSYWDKWETYCHQTGTHPVTPPIPAALKFLQNLISSDTQRGYSAICTARSALSAVILLPVMDSVLGNTHW